LSTGQTKMGCMLSLADLNLTLRFREAELPRWLGSAMRGGFGQHLRRIVCFRPMQECDSCGLSGGCLYYECYERPYAKRGHASPPRPIVLVLPFFGRKIALKGGGRISVELLLLDRTTKNLPHVILALQQFGSQGLGEGRDRLHPQGLRWACSRRGKDWKGEGGQGVRQLSEVLQARESDRVHGGGIRGKRNRGYKGGLPPALLRLICRKSFKRPQLPACSPLQPDSPPPPATASRTCRRVAPRRCGPSRRR